MPHLTNNLMKTASSCIAALLLYGGAFAQTHPFVSFDVPDAVGSTFPLKMNSAGQVTGYFTTKTNHGFIRNADGQITQFDVPNLRFTDPTWINNSGQVVGYGQGASALYYGFLRTPAGRFEKINYPDSHGSWALSINDSGVVAGNYADASGLFHAFIRNASGGYTSFDPASAAGGSGVTSALINNNEEVAGAFSDGSGSHGYFRDSAGVISTFDLPGASFTYPTGLNDSGEITGFYTVNLNNLAFIRHSDGTFTTFSVSAVGATIPSSINASGYICGFVNNFQTSNGFVRDPSGRSSFLSGPQPNGGGACADINTKERATGTYIDSNGVEHAWVR